MGVPEKGPRQLSRIDPQFQRLVSPWALYIPVAALYSGWAVVSIATTGSVVPYITAFCVPVHMMSSWWCYAAEPLSMTILSAFMLFCIPRFGWKAGFIAAGAGVGYDLSGGGIYGLLQFPQAQFPATVVQVTLILLPFIVWRKSLTFHPTWLLCAYLFVFASGAFSVPIVINPFFAYAQEPFLIMAFCTVWYRSIRTRPADSGGSGST